MSLLRPVFILILLAGPSCPWAAGAAAPEPVVPVTPSISLPRDTRSYSAAEADILQDLEARRVELDRREQALELREKLADLLEQRLAGRVDELNTLKAELERLMTGLSGKDDKELGQLAQMYGAMKPAAAASVMNKLDNLIVHDVLVRLPSKKSGKIMENLDPVKVRVVSEIMARATVLPATGVSGTTATPTTVSGR